MSLCHCWGKIPKYTAPEIVHRQWMHWRNNDAAVVDRRFGLLRSYASSFLNSYRSWHNSNNNEHTKEHNNTSSLKWTAISISRWRFTLPMRAHSNWRRPRRTKTKTSDRLKLLIVHFQLMLPGFNAVPVSVVLHSHWCRSIVVSFCILFLFCSSFFIFIPLLFSWLHFRCPFLVKLKWIRILWFQGLLRNIQNFFVLTDAVAISNPFFFFVIISLMSGECEP